MIALISVYRVTKATGQALPPEIAAMLLQNLRKSIGHFKIFCEPNVNWRICKKLTPQARTIAYKEENDKLKREVTLKFLPKDFIRPRGRMRTFQNRSAADKTLEDNQGLNGKITQDGACSVCFIRSRACCESVEAGATGFASIFTVCCCETSRMSCSCLT
jgi:hypothetical protein